MIMSEASKMQRLCESYIRRAGLIGALYGIVPTLLWFLGMFIAVPFRSVYLLRMGLSLVLAGVAGAYLNRLGVRLWLLKHRSTEGPASVLEGTIVGAWIGVGIALLPPLTHFIATHHLEDVKTATICAYLVAAVLGGIIGCILASIARKHIGRGDERIDKPALQGASGEPG
jgi:hypothetical protein